jgi:hypothetical protein
VALFMLAASSNNLCHAELPVVVQGVVRHGQQLVGLAQAVPGPVVTGIEGHSVAVGVCDRV